MAWSSLKIFVGGNMRKIETKLISSIAAWKGFKLDNTEFRLSKINENYGAVLLFNNIIAVVERVITMGGHRSELRIIMAQNAGWPTRTTHSRLRALGLRILYGLLSKEYEYEGISGPSPIQGRELAFFQHRLTHEHIVLSQHFGE